MNMTGSRRICGAHQLSLILQRYDQSGLKQTAFCAREGLNPNYANGFFEH